MIPFVRPPASRPQRGWLRRATLAVAIGLAACSAGPRIEPPPPKATAAAATTATPLPAPAASRAVVKGDAFVMLSGGGTPLSNNYSQYLQARAMAGFFARSYPPERTWVFFGLGNREQPAARLADVRHQVLRDGLVVETWEPGVLPQNRPATRESFLRALREEILPTVQDGGTLYLFIGDHGELTRGRTGESAVTMWKLREDSKRGWSTDNAETLSVTDLRQALAAGLGRGRVVFCMTQCHAGGFHFLGIPREIAPPADWFTTPPAWVTKLTAVPLPLAVAGFTATDEPSLAAGCDPDPRPGHWAGYERFLPEALLGTDLMTGASLNLPRHSFAEAHQAATLLDPTIDKPRSTSEQYLDGWATLIETKLVTEKNLGDRARVAVDAFGRAVDTGQIASRDPALRQRQALFTRFTERLADELPVARELLLHGTRAQLQDAINVRGGRGGNAPRAAAPTAAMAGDARPRPSMAEARKAWTETLRPAWKKAVEGGQVSSLPATAREFETRLLMLEERGRDFVFTPGDESILNELYWRSGYANPATLDRAKAEAVARWGATRRTEILAWAANSDDISVRRAADLVKRSPAWRPTVPAPGRSLSRRTAAERVLFYRRVLAAWDFLLAMDDRVALDTVAELTALEQTPLPPSG